MMPRKTTRKTTQSGRKTRESTRQRRSNGDNIPNVYSDMLAEAALAEAGDIESSPRAVKRRKLGEVQTPTPKPSDDQLEELSPATLPIESIKAQQIVYDDFEDSDESDVEFEDVDLEVVGNGSISDEDQPEQKSLQIDLSKPIARTPSKAAIRRKPVTKAEREFRLDVHKWHVLSLILHGHTRNMWCDDEIAHVALKQLVPKKIISLLHVDEAQPSYQRSHSFTKGIEDICTLWRTAWTITERGLKRPHWKEGIDAQEEFDKAEDPVDLDDFRLAARDRQGSRDLGAQLFTALLRSLALDARLVFSLQVLPFSGVAKGQTPEKPKPTYIEARLQVYGSSGGINHQRKKIRDSPYPVFWTEVLNPITSAWIALDPLVRNTINKPKTQFEPPASDVLNQMTYVLAFEDDNTMHDVTRRYVQWFNAKTRKLRIETTKGGSEWWRKAMRVFRRYSKLPRDQIEDDYLTQRNAAEGMPKNVQEFKNHPMYVLERHLRTNEVIQPKREIGKFSAGLGKNAKVESVYRAQDVHTCRTADAWYRRGRDVKLGQQPLKRAMPKIKRVDILDDDEEMDEDDREGVALYAEFQTDIYQPPPVEHGKIPKNAYGNLDIYVASMIPAGAVHMGHPLAAQAAKVIQIDYADAVTGFVFKGRQGTAVINGVVIAEEYTAAMIATIEGLEWLGTQEVQAARTKIILGIWKRMLTALRIHEKIQNEYGDKAEDSDNDSTYADDQVEAAGGGFMLEADQTEEKTTEQTVSLQALKSDAPTILPDEVVQQPVKITISPHTMTTQTAKDVSNKTQDLPIHDRDFDDDIFGPDDAAERGGFFINDADTAGGGFTIEDKGGGFVAEDDHIALSTETPAMSGEFLKGAVQQSPATPPQEAGGGRATTNATDEVSQAVMGNVETSRTPPAHAGHEEDEAGDITDTSLLSHDPAEDDDEPEWLDEAFDSD